MLELPRGARGRPSEADWAPPVRALSRHARLLPTRARPRGRRVRACAADRAAATAGLFTSLTMRRLETAGASAGRHRAHQGPGSGDASRARRMSAPLLTGAGGQRGRSYSGSWRSSRYLRVNLRYAQTIPVTIAPSATTSAPMSKCQVVSMILPILRLSRPVLGRDSAPHCRLQPECGRVGEGTHRCVNLQARSCAPRLPK